MTPTTQQFFLNKQWKVLTFVSVFSILLWQLLLLLGIHFNNNFNPANSVGIAQGNESSSSSSSSSLLAIQNATTTPSAATVAVTTPAARVSSTARLSSPAGNETNTLNPRGAAAVETTLSSFLLPIQRLLRRQDDDNRNRRPFFILHAGVPKTATTTLQLGLWSLRPELQESNYIYVGMQVGAQRYEPASFDALVNPACQQALSTFWNLQNAKQKNQSNNINKESPSPPPPCWSAFLHDLQQLRNQGRNVIVSDERLSELWKSHYDKASGPGKFHWRAVQEALLQQQQKQQQDWNVQVVLSYRRLYEWLPSAKLQFDKMKGRTQQWPGVHGGSTLSGMYPQLDRMLLTSGRTFGRYQNIEQALAQYTRHFAKDDGSGAVTIWNMAAPARDGRDVVPTFVCDFLLNATTACDKLLLQERDKNNDHSTTAAIRANMAQNYDYDRIAVEAAALHLFNISTVTRGFVRKQLRHFHENILGLTSSDLPQTCPTPEQMERLLRASLAMEERVLPEFYASPIYGKVAHEANFWKAVKKGKYCSADTVAVLANETYRNFLIGLDPQYKQQ